MMSEKNRTRINDQIRISPVMVLKDEQNLGILSLDAAKKIAYEAGLDLVEISPYARPPVCRIMDYGKFKYDQSIKEKEQKKKQRASVVKEIWLSPNIGDHDIITKVNAIKKFIENGDKVHIGLEFRKREIFHKEVGYKVMEKLLSQVSDVGMCRMPPKMEGRNLTCLIEPKKG